MVAKTTCKQKMKLMKENIFLIIRVTENNYIFVI